MFKSGLKIVGVVMALSLLPNAAHAMDRMPAMPNISTVNVVPAPLNTSKTCAMDLMPIAKEIFVSVSPKVHKSSNLRKLVKKNVRPQVFSGKLSVKSARKNATAAGVCLSLLKMENEGV